MRKSIPFLVAAFASLSSYSQDRQFVHTYQSTNLAKGSRDFEVWTTIRMGKESFYRAIDERLEFEIALTDRLQTAIYLNATHKAFAVKGDSTGAINTESEFSISNEWKLKLSDATTSFIGSGLYGEATISATSLELEAKLILDKRINQHLVAFNVVGEWEWEQEVKGKVINGKVEQENKTKLMATPVEFDLAYMYNINTNLGIGLEAKNQYEITTENGLEHNALLLGPTLYWNAKNNKHSVIINFLPEITNLRKTEEQPNSLDLDEYEKYQFRLLLDFSF